MSRATFLAAVRDYHLQWSEEASTNATFEPSEAQVIGSPYSETVVDVAARTEDENRYWRRIQQLANQHLDTP